VLLDSVQQAIGNLHAGPTKLVLYVTGGGSQVLRCRRHGCVRSSASMLTVVVALTNVPALVTGR
jgi:hypothetical protein